MAKYFTIDLVPQGSGTLGDVSASVSFHGTSTLVQLYSDEALTVPIDNPVLLINNEKKISFWVANGSIEYDITLTGPYLLATQVIENIWTLPGPVWADVSLYWEDVASEWAWINPYQVVVTSPSEEATWTPNFQEIIEEACERAGFEIRNGYQFRSARRSLNILFQEWANRGINLWTVEEGEIILSYGQGTYNLPADTVDIIEYVVRQNQGSSYNQVDIVIPRIALPTYAAIPNKLATGRPTQVYVNRQAPIPQINVWPTPNQAGYIFKYWRLRRIKDATRPGYQTADVPFRFVPALIAGLAYHVAIKNPESVDRIGMLKSMYDEAWIQAANEDRDKAPIRFVPMAGYIRG